MKRSQKSTKLEGPEPAPAEASLSTEQGTMTEVKVKTELPDDYIQEVIWQGEAKEEKKAISKDGTTGDVPAEICVVIGVATFTTRTPTLLGTRPWVFGGLTTPPPATTECKPVTAGVQLKDSP